MFYANSNIHPAEEYARRLATLREWAADADVEVVEGAYDPEAWEATAGRIGDAAEAKFGVIANEEGDLEEEALFGANPVGGDLGRPSSSKSTVLDEGGASPAPTEGRTTARRAREARCRACYRLRFEEAAHYAREHGFAALGTTLSVSPYQYTRIIREELERACAREGIKACFADYRPFYDEATRRSREGGMYRQNYCGCRFSDAEAAAERVVNLVSGWNREIQEMMGGMGINAIDSLRGNRLMLRGVGLNEKELEILGVKYAGE